MALIPGFFIDCVVAIGLPSEKKEGEWLASGFLYGDLTEGKEDGKNIYHVYLVTNRHVLKDLHLVILRFNPIGGEQAKIYTLHLIDDSSKKLLWTSHPNPNIDIAVILINWQLLKKEQIKYNFFLSDQHVTPLSKISELGITEGDCVFILGFPMGLIGAERNYVIVRGGNIARIQDAIDRKSNEFLIDAFTFPGNSGGPVVTKPELVSIKGTKAVGSSYLLGIVSGYLPYLDFAISEQTKRRRVMFEENSGLTAVIPIDFVKEAIEEHKKTMAKEMPS